MSSLLAANIGNTRVTLGIFQIPCQSTVDPCLAHSCPVPTGASFTPPFLPDEPVDAAILASVNPAHDKTVAKWIVNSFGIKPLRFPQDVPFVLTNQYEPPESAGADRLANALAAYDEFHSACIIVDAGTAVTIDALSADGAFQGGAILPGIELAAGALAQGTALLPRPDVQDPGPGIPNSTRTAIAAGVLRGTAGAVDRLAADIARELGGCRHFIVTGGDAERLRNLCTTPLAPRPHLTLSGLALAYTRRGQT